MKFVYRRTTSPTLTPRGPQAGRDRQRERGGTGWPHLHRANLFLNEGGTSDHYRAALARAVTLGWLWLHEFATYVKFTPAGAALFA